MTDRHRARQVLVVVAFILGSLVVTTAGPAHAQTSGTEPEPTAVVPPGETAPDGGPLLVPGETEAASDSIAADAADDDNTGTVVALVISGLLLVALLLALLTYWFWRNTRPMRPPGPAPAEG